MDLFFFNIFNVFDYANSFARKTIRYQYHVYGNENMFQGVKQ